MSASTASTCWEVKDRTCSGTSGAVSSWTQRAAARAVMSSASSIRAAGSATRLAWASRTSTLPRMSAAFQADRFAPSWEITQSAAAVPVDPAHLRRLEQGGRGRDDLCGGVAVAQGT